MQYLSHMKRRLWFFILLFGFLIPAKAQDVTVHKLVHAGYVYQNQSFGELGARLLFLENDDVIFRLGGAAMMGAVNKKFAILPKVQGDILLNFERNVDFYHSYYFLAGAEVTTKYVAPKVGVTLAGLVDVTGGYAFPFGDKGIKGKQLKGFNLNVTLNLPIPLIHDLTK